MKDTNPPISIWFIRLRWFAFIAQVIILLVSVFILEAKIDWVRILIILSLIPFSNFLCSKILNRCFVSKTCVAILICLDIVILTAVLYLSGGPANPFTIVFLLHLVLSAILLSQTWTWIYTLITCLAYAFLFFLAPADISHHQHHGSTYSLHLYGMLFAFITVAVLVAYFLNKISDELKQRELKLQQLQQLANNSRRLASIVTITAGVAHEIGTPLSTISLASKELEIALRQQNISAELLEDLTLIQGQVSRCKDYLNSLAEKTGDLTAESLSTIAINDLLKIVFEPIAAANRCKITSSANYILKKIPIQSVTYAIRALCKNALEASTDIVEIIITLESELLTITICDQGSGISKDNLSLIGEPFFSTKDPSQNLGLGVYLARLTAEQLGGKLSIESTLGQGTKIKFSIPENR